MVGIAALQDSPGLLRIVDMAAAIEVDQFRPFFPHQRKPAGILTAAGKRGKQAASAKIAEAAAEQPHHQAGGEPFGDHVVDHFQHAFGQIAKGVADRFGA